MTPLPVRAALSSLALLTVAALATAPAGAEVPIVSGEDVRFSLAGYLRALSGIQRLGYDTRGLAPEEAGLNAAVTRFEWRLNLGERVTLDLHNRFFLSLTNQDASLGADGLGIGVSRPPGRSVDLRSPIVEGDGLLLDHDVDRLVLRIFTDFGDLSVGRQAVTWGYGALFPVADLWTTFSPFELDTSEKRGIDAVRLLTSPAERLELDFIVADKGSLEDLSGGVRAIFYLADLDLYLAAAKLWEQIMLFAGVQVDLGAFLSGALSLRAEVVAAYHLDDGEGQLPRATTGLDYFSSDWIVSLELHFNGLGAKDTPEGYLAQLQSQALARGETYLAGRYYAGLLLSYRLTELVNLGVTSLVNLQDPSAVFAVSAAYQVAENAEIALGAFVPAGASPEIALPPRLGSELGTYPQLFYVQIAAYW